MEETGRDELNNPILEPVLMGLYKGAITQWSTEEIALLNRDVTRTQQKLLTDAPRNVIQQADTVEVANETYSLVDIKSDFHRWRLCHVRNFHHVD